MANDSTAPRGARTPWQVTRSVWYAMFMREAISRTMADRMGWFWMIFEPVAFVAIMIGVRSFVRGDRLIMNAEFIPWLIAGLMGFTLVREGMMRGMGAVDSNKALFAYRQVQPVDPVLVRNFLEGMLRSLVFLILIVGALMLGQDMYPDNALRVFAAWFSLWSLGLGLGLFTSVAASLVPEVGKVIRMLSLPLMLLSGVILPLNSLPHWLLEYLMLNPIPHGLETLRLGFFENYHVVPGTSMLYFWLFTFTLIVLGLLMHLRFIDRLKAS
ncbi:ABC transporter permease [Halomonas dongshanensis]|uniref:Transport permease protein n=1 Tax=Halomonas dongshanensis TaxID=2890835 RepID=A0ABT2EC20_9GAMM|nr:ABC transporter permease [Halomonas dongshanensis]MCS2609130.1 ABC transporter permease [Halomonas dongshanensis]